MEIEVMEIGNVALFRPLAKRIDASKNQEFKDKFNEQLTEGYRLIALNLSLVDFIDSSGLSAIVSSYRATTAQQGKMVIFGVTPAVQNLFHLTGMDRLLKIFLTQDDALKYLDSQKTE